MGPQVPHVNTDMQKLRQRARDKEKKRLKREQVLRENPARHKQEQARNTEARRRARQDPVRRQIEQARNTAARRLARQDPVRRLRERERDTAARRRARQDPVRRLKERERNTIARWLSRQLARNTQFSHDLVSDKGNMKHSSEILQKLFNKITASANSFDGIKQECEVCHKEIKNCSQILSSLDGNEFQLFPNECSQGYKVKFKGKHKVLCSDQCIRLFCGTNNIRINSCSTCHMLFEETSRMFTLEFEGACRTFCSKNCFNFFLLSNRKFVQCNWCKGTKYNVNMLECRGPDNTLQRYCSINCLSMSRARAGPPQNIECDNCQKSMPAQFHLAMSNAAVKNFCSYECTVQFQAQFGDAMLPSPVIKPLPTSDQGMTIPSKSAPPPDISMMLEDNPASLLQTTFEPPPSRTETAVVSQK